MSKALKIVTVLSLSVVFVSTNLVIPFKRISRNSSEHLTTGVDKDK